MKFRIWTGLAVVLTVIAAMVWAADKSDEPAGQVNTTKIALNTDIDKTSYALGVQIGKQLKGAEVNVDVLKQGLSDQMAGRELAMSDEDCQKELQVFSRMMQQKQMAERDALGQKNIQEGKVFLEANAKKEGIVSMLSVPMMVKGQAIGVINLYTDFEHRFSKDEIDTLLAVANQAAVAIENTNLTTEILSVKEALEARKLSERAKGILMNRFSKPEAIKINCRKTQGQRS